MAAQRVRRPREPEAISFLKELNEQTHFQFPGILTIAEESTAWPGVSRPTYLGGLGFSIKWNMGWMNDTLALLPARADASQVSSRRADLQPDLRLPRELHPAAVPRRSGPRQGIAVGPGAGRPVAEVRQLAAVVQLHVDASRQEAGFHGRATSASGTSGTSMPVCNGTCCSGRRTRG